MSLRAGGARLNEWDVFRSGLGSPRQDLGVRFMRVRLLSVCCWYLCSLVLPPAGLRADAPIAPTKQRRDRPFVIKPDGVVLRPKAGAATPGLDVAWESYSVTTDASIRRLADACFDDERQKLLQEGVLPVTPRDAVRKYWSEVDDAYDTLQEAYRIHGDAAAMNEWLNLIASQVPRRFPQEGEYLLVENPIARSGRVIRVESGRVTWDRSIWRRSGEDGAERVVRGKKGVQLPAEDVRGRMDVKGLVSPENGRRIDVSIDCLLQTYELRLTEPNGRHVVDVAGRVVPLSVP